MRETSVSDPLAEASLHPLMTSKPEPQSCSGKEHGGYPTYWPCDVRCKGGVTLILALLRNLRTCLVMLRERHKRSKWSPISGLCAEISSLRRFRRASLRRQKSRSWRQVGHFASPRALGPAIRASAALSVGILDVFNGTEGVEADVLRVLRRVDLLLHAVETDDRSAEASRTTIANLCRQHATAVEHRA